MICYGILLLVGLVAAGEHQDNCGCGIHGVGPGYEKSYLDYAGKFKGGARKFLPVYEKICAHEKEELIKGGCGAHDHEYDCGCRHKRGLVGHHDDCGCKHDIHGVGPGYERSHLDYAGKFKGGARKFLPIYEKAHAHQKEVLIKGGCGAHDKEYDCGYRHKRSVDGHHEDCGCKHDIHGVGPGYERSHLDYAGKFKGGARKFLPIYEKAHAHQKEVLIKGGCGAHDQEYDCGCRHKRGLVGHHDDCECKHDIHGVGPGYERSHLDYAGKFKGGARKFLPIYEKAHAHQKEVLIKGGCGAHDKEYDCGRRHKRGLVGHHDDCKCKHDIHGVGPGYERSHLDYAGKFKGGARKFLPIYEKQVGSQREVLVKGGPGACDHEPHHCHHLGEGKNH